MEADRQELARRIHRLVDLWAAGELDSFEWSARIDRLADYHTTEERVARKVRREYIRPDGVHYVSVERVLLDAHDYRQPETYSHPLMECLHNLIQKLEAAKYKWRYERDKREERNARERLYKERLRGMKWKDVAARAGMSASTARSRYNELRAKLAQMTERDRLQALADMGVFND